MPAQKQRTNIAAQCDFTVTSAAENELFWNGCFKVKEGPNLNKPREYI